jgi:hypothetical protein
LPYTDSVLKSGQAATPVASQAYPLMLAVLPVALPRLLNPASAEKILLIG